MTEKNLVITLKTLSKDEWKSFRKHLLGLTNSSSDLFSLFTYLQKQKDSLDKLPTIEEVRTKHFSKLKTKGLSNLMSKLFGILEYWLVIQELQETPYQKELFLVKAFNNKGLYKLANKTALKLETRILKGDISLQAAALTVLYHTQYYSNNPIKANRPSLFLELTESFTIKTKEQAMLYMLEMQNRSRNRGDNFHLIEKMEWLKILLSSNATSNYGQIIELILKFFETGDEQNLTQTMDQLESQNIDKGSDIYLVLISYMCFKSNHLYHRNQLKDLKLYLDLHRMRFVAFVKNKKHKLRPVHFFNQIHLMAISLGYEKTTLFISEWIDSVHTLYKDSCSSFSFTINAFRNERYDEIPRLLVGLKFDDVIHKLESNIILIIAHYKLEEEDLVHVLLSNFKKQLKRNKSMITVTNFKGLSNLCDFLLLRLKSKYNDSIKIDLNNLKPIFYKSWVKREMENH